MPAPLPKRRRVVSVTEEVLFGEAGVPIASSSTQDAPLPTPPNPWNPGDDPIQQNVRLLVRDLLYYRELEQCISGGDVGRIEDIMPDLAAIFMGAGSNKYAMEIIWYLNHLEQVWTKEFAYSISISFS
ncbi:hypothetical protein MPER_14590 [Moniliophthora perniciosa FA553]|nr:hypothetical protein MPER_14590 [Moniliophthora perniciosa FA553]